MPPLLHIEFASAAGVRVWWPSPSTGFGLQSSPSPAPAGWADYPGAVSGNATTYSVLFPISSAPPFFASVPHNLAIQFDVLKREKEPLRFYKQNNCKDEARSTSNRSDIIAVKF